MKGTGGKFSRLVRDVCERSEIGLGYADTNDIFSNPNKNRIVTTKPNKAIPYDGLMLILHD